MLKHKKEISVGLTVYNENYLDRDVNMNNALNGN